MIHIIKQKYIQFKVRFRNRPKVFVIGLNKTGTTTLEHTLADHKFVVGHQRSGEACMNSVMKGDYDPLISYCRKAEAFQDVPFSVPGVYKILDKAYPNSKFILTVRNNADQWFNSMVRFHTKLWGEGEIPTQEVLGEVNYVYKGYALEVMKFLYGDKLYHSSTYKEIYNQHIANVKNYFASKPKQLLVINVEIPDSYSKFCAFLNLKPKYMQFYQKNKT